MKLITFFERWYLPLRLGAASPNGRRLHLVSLRNFDRFLGRTAFLRDLTDENLVRFQAWHLDRGNSPYTANRDVARLLAQWRLACRKSKLKIWPDVRYVPEPRREPRAWNRQQLRRLFAVLEKIEGVIAGVPAAGWWVALHWLMWATGERVGALMALEWTAYEAPAWLCVPAEARKGQTADKVYRLSVDACEALAAIRLPARRLIFPWDRSKNILWRRYKRILRAAGLPDDRKSMFHRMRKSAASHLEAAGGNATELLGHSDRKVTLAYLDVRIVGRQHAADLLFDPRG